MPALPFLLAALKSDAAEIRQGAAVALEKVGDASAVPALVEALQDSDYWVRSDATIALGTLGDPSALAALFGMLEDSVGRVRESAVEAIGRLGGSSVVPHLIAILKGGDYILRVTAATALGLIGDTSAVPSLIDAMNENITVVMNYAVRDSLPTDRRTNINSAAGKALWNMGTPPILSRKIITDSRFSAQQRIDILDALRREYHKFRRDTSLGTFIDTRSLCEAILGEEDANARKGAQTLLNWLDGDRNLLMASQPDSVSGAHELLRASQGGVVGTQPELLLRGSFKPE